MNIFVGNLSFDAKEADVQRVFMAFGVVTSVAIVMEKKGKKSRGFGFVEMPDEQEALAAIAQLQGKEILGRPINVVAALSKEPKKQSSSGENKTPAGFKRTGKYREGRRTISYMKQRLDAGIAGPVTERKYKPNPLRWRKKPRFQPHFAKPEGGTKPWKKTEGVSSPWKKAASESKPWEKSRGGPKPWRKSSDARQQPNFKKRASQARHKK